MKEEYLYWIWLNEIKGIGPVTAKKLLYRFISPERIYNASENEVRELKGMGDKLILSIIESKNLDNAKRILEKCEKQNINIITYLDGRFPSNINNYPGMPTVLYYRGILYDDVLGVAIVGSRRCSDYGKKVAVDAAKFLAENKIPVISGMAKGIDSYAHTACIKQGGYTIGFLGCGVDICYPKEHSRLMDSIIENGSVISEYPPGTMPSTENFPKRNRLISACSQKLLVVEAGERSGALITAKYAKEQNKEIFAVPNNIYIKESKGTNRLIFDGANMYLNPNQLLIKNSIKRTVVDKIISISDEEKNILSVLRNKAYTADEICIFMKKDKTIILDVLFSMELEGKIKCVGGRYIVEMTYWDKFT